MSKEYYTVEKRNNLGELNIGVSVFQSIVVHTISEVEVIIDYGKNVSQLVNDVQSEVVNAIKNMAGFRTVKVNVNVSKIKF